MNNDRSTSSLQQFLTFAIAPNRQGMLPTEQLVKILSVDPATVIPIPDMPATVVGVCPWQNEVLWLVDIAYLLGFDPLLTSEYHQPKCNILAVTSSDNSVGFLVRHVGQLIRTEQTQIQIPPPSVTPPLSDQYLLGLWNSPEGESLLVLDVEAILQNFE